MKFPALRLTAKLFISSFIAVTFLTLEVRAIGDEHPAWVRAIANASAPTYGKDVPAVVLLREERKTVDEQGRTLTTTQFAVRILNGEGRGYARAVEGYIANAGKVREMRAWLVRPNGEVRRYGKDEIADVSHTESFEMYSEVRLRVINASDDATTGCVFAYESTVEDKSIFTQFEHQFQNSLPTLISRFVLTLPTGWRAESVTFNHAEVKPTVNASAYTWELTNLAPIESEPAAPEITSLAPRVGVSYFPSAGKQMVGGAFTTWRDASLWMANLTDNQSTPDEAIANKTRALTANAKTEFERIATVANFVQNIQYVAISLDLGRGGGYRPRTAAEVLAKSYGDCKDKANLMRAMLKTINIESYLVPVFAGDRSYVRESFPSPTQFNHCIIAVKVSDTTQAPTVISHPQLGRLLIFDATDEATLLGDLPEHEQDSFALIVAGEKGSLVRLPVTAPETNNVERTIIAELSAEGFLTAKVAETFTGQPAADSRREARRMSKAEYANRIERWIAHGANSASVTNLKHQDNTSAHRFDLSADFTAASYAQSMQGRLLVFKPVVLSRRSFIDLSAPQRRHPVMLDSNSFVETTRIKLPVGFAVDELPDAVKLETAFGSYQISYEVKGDTLIGTRRFSTRAAMLPASEYNAVRNFYGRILAAEQAPAVLAKN